MSPLGAFDAKERIRQETDIAELVGESIPLRRQGKMFVGVCPWHDDSRPSLQVNPERQSWKCWVCDIGGDVFSFMMKRENVEFREALQMLGERSGIDLREALGRPPTKSGDPNDKQTLLRAMAWATEQYHRCLLESPDAAIARDYLRQRDINEQSIARFRIGYSPESWQWLIDRSRSTEFSTSVLEAIGVAAKSERSGRHYDRFRCRVLFPISDAQKRPIGMGGRILPEFQDDRSAKYINSQETLLYAKSEQLYGLELARDCQAMKRGREVIVMEGYTDVVMASQLGVEQAVAVCGTALTERHLRLLRRYADRITLVLDGDAAGQNKANSILELFVASQVDLRIVTLPDGLDPCDFIMKQGAAQFNELVAQAPDALEHKIRVQTQGLDPLHDTHRSNVVLQEMLSTIARAPRVHEGGSTESRLREQQVLNRLAREFRIDESQLRSQVLEIRGKQRTNPILDSSNEPTPQVKPHLTRMERDLFELLIRNPEAISRVLETVCVSQLETATARQLYDCYAELEAQGLTPDYQRVILEFDEPEMKNLLVELDEDCQKKFSAESEAVLSDLLLVFERRYAEAELRDNLATLESGKIDEEKQLHLLQDLIRRRQEMN